MLILLLVSDYGLKLKFLLFYTLDYVVICENQKLHKAMR